MSSSDPVTAGDEAATASLEAEVGHLHPAAPTLPSSEGDLSYRTDDAMMDIDIPLSSDSLEIVEEKLEEGEYGRGTVLRVRCQAGTRGGTATSRPVPGGGQALARQILNGQKVTAFGWCELIDLVPSKKNGYIQLSWDGANKFATAGEVCLWAQGRSKPVENDLPKGYALEEHLAGVSGQGSLEASHRCNHPRCRVWEHVCLESHTANEARKGCIVWVSCSPSCSGCRGEKVILVCPHNPCCIRAHPNFRSLEEFLTNGVCRDSSKDTARFFAEEAAALAKGFKLSESQGHVHPDPSF